MKRITFKKRINTIATFFSLTLVLSGVARANVAQADLELPFPNILREMPTLVPIYEAMTASSDQLLTKVFGEGAPYYRYKMSQSFYVTATPIQNSAAMIPIYRCYSGRDHFVAIHSNCEGAKTEYQYGYIYQYSSPGFLPLYRMYNRSLARHLITTNQAAASSRGYYTESVLGYVFPPTEMQNPVPIPYGDSPWTPIYAATSSYDHLLSMNEGEGAPTYTYNGIAFYVFKNANLDFGQPFVGLYRCLSGLDHFATTRPNCEGATVESFYGYIFQNPSPGLAPLYRYYSAAKRNHWITANTAEVTPDYYVEQILGYVPATQFSK